MAAIGKISYVRKLGNGQHELRIMRLVDGYWRAQYVHMADYDIIALWDSLKIHNIEAMEI